MNVEDNWYFLRVIESLIVIIEHPVMRMFCLVFFQIFLFFPCSSLDCLGFTETGGWDLFSNSCCFVKYDYDLPPKKCCCYFNYDGDISGECIWKRREVLFYVAKVMVAFQMYVYFE